MEHDDATRYFYCNEKPMSVSPRRRVALTSFGFVVLWAYLGVVELSPHEFVFQIPTPTTTTTAANNVAEKHASVECESPSLPRGSVHVVVAAYKYNEMESNIGFDENNYLWNLGLTNAEIYWYRREHTEIPLRQVDGPCGMRLNERLLLPNYGREGAAFLDHVLEFYDDPPKSIVFLHGHGAIGWHTSCESVFARTAYVYRHLVSDDHTMKNDTVQNHMMSLTSPANGTLNFAMDWYGGSIQDKRRLSEEGEEKYPCQLFKARWGKRDGVFSGLPRYPQFKTCCASFILPGDRIRRYPNVFYEELQALLTNETLDDQGRECFEFIIYDLFGENPNTFTEQQVKTFYDEADGLLHGNNRSVTSVELDGVVLRRVEGCKATRSCKRMEGCDTA